MPKVFLIGMPGSGKSTIGKALSAILEYSFLDFDSELERNEGATIAAIFSIKGEDYFRQLEAQVLSTISEKEENLVVATGGGTPCYYNGIEHMNTVGRTVFIDVSTSKLIERLKAEVERPLLKDDVEQNIMKLYNDRINIYTKAHIKIEADNLSIDDLLTRIVEELKLIP